MPLNEHKLLLALEVGPTFSSVSYSILEPGKKPEIQAIRKLQGQELPSGNTGIPSVSSKALPLDGVAVEVLSDLLKYLNNRAEQHIQQVHPGIGSAVWNGPQIHYILLHPNGWKEPQRSLLRQAAEMAGLIKGGRNQLSFVTQGEAMLNLYADRGLLGDLISKGDGIIVVDAGEGTLGISAYASRNGDRPFEEIAAPKCSSEGSVFVTEAAGEYLYGLFKDSKFLKDVPKMKRHFEQTIQRTFSDHNDTFSILVCPVDGKNVKRGVPDIRLRLDGNVIGSFFQPSIKHIVDDVLSLRRAAKKSISTVLLVGSFSASDYVFRCVKESLESHGLQVLRPDAQVNQLVTDGAVSSALNRPSAPATRTSNITPLSTRAPSAVTIAARPPQPLPPPTPAPRRRFDKLSDDNYHEWKIYMTAHLVKEGLLGIIDGTESHPGQAAGAKKLNKFNNKKARARAELILHVSPSQLSHCSSSDPALIWNALATAHTMHRRVTINSLLRQLHRLSLGSDETMSAFIGRARHLAFLVKEAGGDVTDDDLILAITAGLPPSYGPCVTFLDTLPESEYNIDAIRIRLVSEYQRQNAISLSTL